jgi:NADH dehydrogenase FAD-containing subunit
MGRAAGMQATVVASNINRSIKGKSLKEYHPLKLLEDGIDLTLGLVRV